MTFLKILFRNLMYYSCHDEKKIYIKRSSQQSVVQYWITYAQINTKKHPDQKIHFKHQCRIQMFSGHTVFLKLRIGQFSDTQKPPMVVAEGLKIFDVQWIWRRIFVSFKKIFDFKYSQTISFTFYVNYVWKKCYKNFFG